ncbi:MAG: cation diffusion facilitator family transporter [Candidatus Aminicenantia bacterium]
MENKLFESDFRIYEKRVLLISLGITLSFMFLEIAGGLILKSMALISDAIHMFTHAFATGLGIGAILIARKPPCHHRTFGLYKAEILASFINGLTLIPVSGLIIYYSVRRIVNPSKILGSEMFLIALLGLFANVASMLILRKYSRKNINVKSIFFHIIGDALSSIAVMIASLLIILKKWFFFDPIVSFGISILITYWAFSVLLESGKILLEMAPEGMDIEKISKELIENFPEIEEISNGHIWSITKDMLVFSAHITVKKREVDQNDLLTKINNFLKERYPIIECTIQVKI